MRFVTPKLVVRGHLHGRYTDWVRVSGDRWARVDGHGGDDATKRDVPGYKATDAWLVLDLADVLANLDDLDNLKDAAVS